jgi:hypothetical protein
MLIYSNHKNLYLLTVEQKYQQGILLQYPLIPPAASSIRDAYSSEEERGEFLPERKAQLLADERESQAFEHNPANTINHAAALHSSQSSTSSSSPYSSLLL